MSESFLGPLSSGSDWAPTIAHEVVHTMAGEIDALRARLSAALERVGYRVINETPIQGKRSGTTAGANGCSTDILESPAGLTVGLRSVSPGLTRATFAYEIRQATGYLSKGDRRTLDRESEAIVAIAHAQMLTGACFSCRAPLAGAARFCRQCGAPVRDPDSLPEVEILKLTADVNAGYKWIAPSAILLLVALLMPFFLLLGVENSEKYARIVRALFICTGVLGSLGLSMLTFGLWKLRQVFNRRSTDEKIAIPMTYPIAELSVPTTSELVHQSITDETTSLLPHENVHRSKGF